MTKVDDERGESDAAELWSLGLGEPHPVSGLHGRGSGDLLDAVLEALPDAPPVDTPRTAAARAGSRWSAGRTSASPACSTGSPARNASVVDAVAGTTVDPVDSLVELDGADLAVRRHRRACAGGSATPAAWSTTPSLRTAAAIEAAEVAVVLLDAREPLTEQDQRVIAEVVDAGRALVLAFNKWDLLDEDRRDAARARDRPGPRPGGVGAAGQRLGADRPRGRAAGRAAAACAWRRGTGGSRPAG